MWSATAVIAGLGGAGRSGSTGTATGTDTRASRPLGGNGFLKWFIWTPMAPIRLKALRPYCLASGFFAEPGRRRRIDGHPAGRVAQRPLAVTEKPPLL